MQLRENLEGIPVSVDYLDTGQNGDLDLRYSPCIILKTLDLLLVRYDAIRRVSFVCCKQILEVLLLVRLDVALENINFVHRCYWQIIDRHHRTSLSRYWNLLCTLSYRTI